MLKELSAHPVPSDKLPTAIYEALAQEYEEGFIYASPVSDLQVVKVSDLPLTDPTMGCTGFRKTSNATWTLSKPDVSQGKI